MNSCTHLRSIPGAEGDYCPDCQKHIKPSDSPRPVAAIGNSESNSNESVLPSDSPHSDWHFVHPYKSHGSQYFRYVWGTGHKISGVRHIPGGNIRNPIAQARAAQVRSQIAAGIKPAEIREFIDRFTW